MPDVLKLHADGTPDKHAVIVDASHGARPSVTTFAELNAAREPARPRAPRPSAPSRATGSSGADRTRSRCIAVDPRGPQGRPGRGPALVPLQRRGDAVRHRQLRRDARDRRRRVRAARRRGTRPAAEGPGVRRVRRHRRRRRSSRRVGVLGRRHRRASPTRSRRPRTPSDGRRADALHVGHHREAEGRAAHRRPNREIVFALLGELGLQLGNEVHITTGPLYHSGPLAFVSLSHTLGAPIIVLRRFDPVAWLAAGEAAPGHEHVLRADAAQADREPARRGARARRPARRCAA